MSCGPRGGYFATVPGAGNQAGQAASPSDAQAQLRQENLQKLNQALSQADARAERIVEQLNQAQALVSAREAQVQALTEQYEAARSTEIEQERQDSLRTQEVALDRMLAQSQLSERYREQAQLVSALTARVNNDLGFGFESYQLDQDRQSLAQAQERLRAIALEQDRLSQSVGYINASGATGARAGRAAQAEVAAQESVSQLEAQLNQAKAASAQSQAQVDRLQKQQTATEAQRESLRDQIDQIR